MPDETFAAFDATLRDGRVVHLRAVRTTDEGELLQAFGRLSPDARYTRFMHAIRELNVEWLRTSLASLPERGAAVVATIPADDGIDIVGSASFLLERDPTSCEFAITVQAEYGGTGLGRVLMTALIDTATRRGLTTMKGFVLAENTPMLRLARRLGFSIESDPDDRALCVCAIPLNPA